MRDLCAEFETYLKAYAAQGRRIDEGSEVAGEWWKETALELAAQDNPEFDGTYWAHPAWWSGNDAGCATIVRKVNEILDGDGTLHGTCREPWESFRTRNEKRAFHTRTAAFMRHTDFFSNFQVNTKARPR